jgi:hypothetical protein
MSVIFGAALFGMGALVASEIPRFKDFAIGLKLAGGVVALAGVARWVFSTPAYVVAMPASSSTMSGVNMPGISINESGIKMPGITINDAGIEMPGISIRT